MQVIKCVVLKKVYQKKVIIMEVKTIRVLRAQKKTKTNNVLTRDEIAVLEDEFLKNVQKTSFKFVIYF